MKDYDALMERVKAGDSAAFAELFAEFNKEITRFLAGKIRVWQTAEDVAQTVWLRVHQSARLYCPLGQFRAWLMRMAKNALIDYVRSSRHDRKCGSIDDSDNGMESLSCRIECPEDRFETMLTADEASQVGEFLPLLPEDQSMVFCLHVFCGLSLSEVAQQMGSSHATAKSRYRLAKNRLIEKSDNCGLSCQIDPFCDRANIVSSSLIG